MTAAFSILDTVASEHIKAFLHICPHVITRPSHQQVSMRLNICFAFPLYPSLIIEFLDYPKRSQTMTDKVHRTLQNNALTQGRWADELSMIKLIKQIDRLSKDMVTVTG